MVLVCGLLFQKMNNVLHILLVKVHNFKLIMNVNKFPKIVQQMVFIVYQLLNVQILM